MSFKQIHRLLGKTSEDLMICEQKIQNWTKFMNDYKALGERLSTLTDKTRHEVMVPIGGSNVAFMSGYIKHTNEILVLLGDNYFVERSAKEAKDMVDRRVTNCREMIGELNKEKTQINNWLTFCQQFSDQNRNQDFVEIVEQYDEQKEKEWKEVHKQRVREYKWSQKSDPIDSEINAKLERLEVQEYERQIPELKSILKKDVKLEDKHKSVVTFDETNKSVELMGEEKEQKQLDKTSERIEDKSTEIAFKNEVKERKVEHDLSSQSIVNINSSPKIVSRFKSNRMKK